MNRTKRSPNEIVMGNTERFPLTLAPTCSICGCTTGRHRKRVEQVHVISDAYFKDGRYYPGEEERSLLRHVCAHHGYKEMRGES